MKENTKAPRHWPLCGEFTGTGEFPAQRASNAENVSIWWRHHVYKFIVYYHPSLNKNLSQLVHQHNFQTTFRFNAMRPGQNRWYFADDTIMNFLERKSLRFGWNVIQFMFLWNKRMMHMRLKHNAHQMETFSASLAGDRWIPLTKASDAELWCFILSVPEQTGE